MTVYCCGQSVSPTGFCDVCGRQTSLPPPDPATEAHPTERMRTPVIGRSSSWAAGEVYSLPPIEAGEPNLLTDPNYPEGRQVCGNPTCRRAVGRAIGGQPPIREGFCPYCATPFSFLPKLDPGEVVADRYEIIGWLAQGGLGWIYLARDRHLPDMRVVLKGIVNSTDAQAMQLARVERDVMIRLDHPNIVRIITYVEHPNPRTRKPDDYIVMEYVDGKTLSDILKSGPGLRLEEVTTYGRWILSAMDYLHSEGLLYCDMKPDNVMHGGKRVKLIDLGATRAIGDRDSVIVGAHGFQVSSREIARYGLTVRSDVHTVGKTLDRLFTAAQQRERDPVAVSFGVESLRRLLRRAVAPFEERFASAAEMSEQLDGVHRELLSLRDGKPRRTPSTRFDNTAELLDAGLGAVPGLERWTGETAPDSTVGDGLPDAPSAAYRLPIPRVDEADPAAGYLAAAGALGGPRKLLREYEEFRADSVELDLARARAHLELGRPAAAEHRIARAEEQLLERAGHDWRIWWHRGLLRLAKNQVVAAQQAFDRVYSLLPGEAAPKLALGFCLEHGGEHEQARQHYEVVWHRDEEQASAAFGLARTALRQGNRDQAVHILDRLPRVSRHYDAAQIATVRILLARVDGALPGMHNINAAADRLPQLYLDSGEDHGEARQRLVTILRETALARVLAPVRAAGAWAGGDLLGEHVTERALRLLLEQSFHDLAKYARDEQEHGVLTDLANSVRPWTKR
jgi:serine/threonine-protein kinase PknG